MANCLYTGDEIKGFIKAIDLKLNSGVSKSDLDTSQSRGSFTLSTRALQIQKEQWMAMLKQVDPDCYHSLKGPSVIKFKESTC
jgi:hypothetical protein